MAKLFFRYGVMGSSKSAHLLMTGFNFQERGRNIVYLKPAMDDREGNRIASRIGLSEECINISFDESILPYIEGFSYEIILIDEVQFFSEKQIEELTYIADILNIMVICYGLRTDARGYLFEGSKRLIELADSIEELKSTCSCGQKATMNARLNEKGEMYIPQTQVDIGGNDKYVAMCRKCWMEKKTQNKKSE